MELVIYPTVLANTVTSFAVILSGALAVIFCKFVAPQPSRWKLVYYSIIITGVPTLWYHGFGETFVSRVFDVGTNALLGLMMAIAVLGDYYSRKFRFFVGSALLIANVLVITDMIFNGASSVLTVHFGESYGFTIRQVILVVDGLLATFLLYFRYKNILALARPLLHIMTLWFLAGALLAAFSIHKIGGLVFAYHAIWHLVASFGFILLWAFNHLRFSDERKE